MTEQRYVGIFQRPAECRGTRRPCRQIHPSTKTILFFSLINKCPAVWGQKLHSFTHSIHRQYFQWTELQVQSQVSTFWTVILIASNLPFCSIPIQNDEWQKKKWMTEWRIIFMLKWRHLVMTPTWCLNSKQVLRICTHPLYKWQASSAVLDSWDGELVCCPT